MTPKTAAIIQSNYIPWKGYFDIIHLVDEFILFDDVQYTRRDWRNRNMIKTPQGLQWLTIPVNVKNNYYSPINEVTVADDTWRKKHWMSIVSNYGKASYFNEYKAIFEDLYLNSKETLLSQVNYQFIKTICQIFGIQTRISWSTDYTLAEGKNEKLMELCKQVGATRYISGPAAKDYIDETIFTSQGIEVAWMDYSGYPEYRQLFGPFEHGVSVLDLLFNEGSQASAFMKSFALKPTQ